MTQNISFTINSTEYSKQQLIENAVNRIATAQAGSFEYKLYDFILNWFSDKPEITIATSGSTGQPKTITVSKQTMRESARITGAYLKLRKGDKALLCLPVDYIAGKMMVVRAFELSLDLITVTPVSNPLENIDMSFHFAAMTPMQVHSVFESFKGVEKLNKIETLIIGGGGISRDLIEKISSLTNKTFHTYGMTETVSHVALKRLNGNRPDKFFKALKGITFETDERGCLVITAPHLSKKKIITNDIVNLKSSTEFEFNGRFDNVINTGGIKIFPETVEKKLSEKIRENFFVAGLPDDRTGEKVVLIVETDNFEPEKYRKIIDSLDLTPYEKPKEVYSVKKFRMTDTGKTDRKRTLLMLKS